MRGQTTLGEDQRKASTRAPPPRLSRGPSIPHFASAFGLLISLAEVPLVRAQTPPVPEGGRPTLAAARVSTRIVIDGRLDEADWKAADAAGGFLQRDPDEGQPATEQTEVRILFDDEAIYVGARMFDRTPGALPGA